MRKLLTDRSLQATKPKGTQFMVWDQIIPAFGVRVSAGGKKAFIVMRRPAGGSKPIRVTLGHYPAMSLERARQAASAALAELISGKVPRQERERRLAEQREIEATTFRAVTSRYLQHIASRRSRDSIAGLIEREWISRFGDRPIASISRREIIAAIEGIRDCKRRKGGKRLGGPAAARKALRYLKRICRFAVARDLLTTSPADHVSAAELLGKETVRQRTLIDAEIKQIWTAMAWDIADDTAVQHRGRWPSAPFVRLLLLLGVRRGELAAARWTDIDLQRRTWLIPSEHAKTAEPHLVPLPLEAVHILESLPRFTGCEFVFTYDGKRPIVAWSPFKERIDEMVGKIKPWTLHDLRRSARSNWSALGVQPHIAEMMLGHRQGGIIGTYDTHRFEHERRAALEAWSRRIAEIVSPGAAAKVLPFPA